MVIRTIKLTSLFVNTENYRFEPLSSQKEAIDKMIEDQGDKLYSLVDDIVTNGLSPVDLIIVTPNEDSNKYVVLEGNRRITSLKLLNNPTLIDDKYSPLRKKFQKLQKEKPNAISELKNIACAVFETPTEADIWIKRKHSGELNGIGTVTWNAQQKQRFEEKTEGKSSIPLQIITLLKSQEEVSDTIKDSLSNETKLLLVELFDEMQTAANQCNRGGKQTFFTAASPKSENPTVFTVEDSRIVPVIQRFEILPKPPLPFGTE